ncbi:hypothetical protein HJFPF1_00581 [Paramyrothecium foliicola]|nr:hypothetical protein HJFPF1_00581 [Paramyrothecium foliicola]
MSQPPKQSNSNVAEILMFPPEPPIHSGQSTPAVHEVKNERRLSVPVSELNEQSGVPRHRFLTSTEWAILAHGIGGIKDVEHPKVIHPRGLWWPQRGMPQGLYRDVVTQRTRYYYMFHYVSILRWFLMVMQLFLGAALTALGSVSWRDGTPITILGAANTIIAGLLALLHNSGLPDRHKNNMFEFERLQDHIKELLESGLIPAHQTLDQALAGCFHAYQDAKATVAENMPLSYNSRRPPQPRPLGGRQSAIMSSSRLSGAHNT